MLAFLMLEHSTTDIKKTFIIGLIIMAVIVVILGSLYSLLSAVPETKNTYHFYDNGYVHSFSQLPKTKNVVMEIVHENSFSNGDTIIAIKLHNFRHKYTSIKQVNATLFYRHFSLLDLEIKDKNNELLFYSFQINTNVSETEQNIEEELKHLNDVNQYDTFKEYLED